MEILNGVVHGIGRAFSDPQFASSTVSWVETVVLGLAGLWLKSHYSEKIKASRFGEVYDAVCAGAASVYQITVRHLEDAARDGLSKKDIDTLSERAYAEALKSTKNPRVRAALVKMTDQQWDRWLAKAIGLLKAEGRAGARF